MRCLRNLVAEVKGTERPGEVVAVGAHMDSFPGTVGGDDNASGCARLVEFARWFNIHPPARTVRFIWFTGEELDCRGSHAYVTAHARDPEQICLYVNVDSGVSRDHEPFPVPVADPVAVGIAIHESLADISASEGPAPFRRAAHCSAGSDCAPFHAVGVPAMAAPGAGRRTKSGPYPHLPTDTAANVDPGCLLTATVLGLAFVDAAQAT